MTVLLALGTGAVVCAATYVFLDYLDDRALTWRRLRQSIGSERQGTRGVPGEGSQGDRLALLSSLLGGLLRRWIPYSWNSLVRRRLLTAGIRTTLEHFIGLWALLIGIWYLILTAIVWTTHLPWYVYPMGVGVALLVPFWRLALLEGERRRRLRKAIPFLVDFVTMCVEAGLSLEAAFARASQRMRGPLQEELRRYIQNVNRSATRREALNSFAEDVGLPEVRDFVAVVIQSETFGLPLAGVLKAQALQLREERRLLAGEMAQKIPIKLLIPLVVFIFPTIFLLILGPAAVWTIRILTEQ